jgi:hypothetical protein
VGLISITIVLIIPAAHFSVGWTAVFRFAFRASNKTNQPSFLFLWAIYFASCAGPGRSRPFNIFNSTTCRSAEENVTSTSTNPIPTTGSRIAAPRPSSFALAKIPRISCPCFSARLRNFPFDLDSQKELTPSASTVLLNSSRNVRIVMRRSFTRRLPEASTLSATVFEMKRTLFF